MNPKKMTNKVKKPKAPVIAKEEPAKNVLIYDTTYLGLGQASWENIYNLLEAEDPEELKEEAIADSTSKSENTLKELAYLYLHRIATHAKVLPYNDLVKWVIERINITDKTFFTSDGRMFGSFRAEDIKSMYHFPELEKLYNEEFLDSFTKENAIKSEPIR